MRTGLRFIGKPFSITGRTGRKGFWRFLFFYAVVMTALAVGPFSGRLLVNAFIFGLTLLLVLSAVRRLRDTGMSGWLEIALFWGAVLGYLVPFIRWTGQAMDGPITQFCRRRHLLRPVHPGRSLGRG
ncbi:MAG: DUF805 domain-containing protein [Chloroflexota bacterium]|nr:DUF805 domain-containing protein [Chloroflexota bacterium]